ncbi:SAM-dependent methyltransferase [Halodesulfurarchaeum sp. HSR-GB]|uniref:SAM-dependent methyltransferase n=1 Tax=Halodesulfurarchaeum sp. HSR-GB TaxID=3074077 RepID=UPI0028574BDF|nr:SAM-dependent methyltransferase [Halodesulfurarchaeum sp. HSR-GB]MDR5657129.1 SAM-dependent methyltransferase [Halodesulfurarchaeum sp. HSR-GB]
MFDIEPIGTVHTPIETSQEAPSQGLKDDIEGTIEIDPAYERALQGIEVGDEIVVVWFADEADRSLLELDKVPGRGVFNSRSPARPNPIVITPCTVTEVSGTEIGVRGVDMIDGSPVLDLKSTLHRDLNQP